MQQSLELGQRCGPSLGDHIDRALVFGIHDPSDQAKPISLATHPPPVADALDTAHDAGRQPLPAHPFRGPGSIGQASMAASSASLGAADSLNAP